MTGLNLVSLLLDMRVLNLVSLLLAMRQFEFGLTITCYVTGLNLVSLLLAS